MSARYYADLLVNRSRIEAFKAGIEEAVGEGDRVVDLGTGLGTYAFFAARAGAGAVWGVDESPVVHLAETLAAANGLADAVRFVRGKAPDVELPASVDVLIFEDFPVALLDGPTWRLLRAVQEESLAPGGRMVPRAARLCLAPVESERLRGSIFPLDRWEEGERAFGLHWSPVRDVLANTPRREQLGDHELRGRPARGPVLSFVPVPSVEDLAVAGRWPASEAGTVHALALWFDLQLTEDSWISNEPRPEPEPWGQWILPLDPPLPVAEGEVLEAHVAFEMLPDGAPGWLSWEGRSGSQARRGHEFGGILAGPPDLERHSDGISPRSASALLSERGR